MKCNKLLSRKHRYNGREFQDQIAETKPSHSPNNRFSFRKKKETVRWLSLVEWWKIRGKKLTLNIVVGQNSMPYKPQALILIKQMLCCTRSQRKDVSTKVIMFIFWRFSYRLELQHLTLWYQQEIVLYCLVLSSNVSAWPTVLVHPLLSPTVLLSPSKTNYQNMTIQFTCLLFLVDVGLHLNCWSRNCAFYYDLLLQTVSTLPEHNADIFNINANTVG